MKALTLPAEGFADFMVGFADAGEDDFVGVAAGFEGAEEFAAGGDVHAGAFRDECFEDVDVGKRFDAVADEGIEGGEGFGDAAVVGGEGGFGVDVDGGTDLGGDFGDGDLFGVELAVAVVEVVHGILLGGWEKRGIIAVWGWRHCPERMAMNL